MKKYLKKVLELSLKKQIPIIGIILVIILSVAITPKTLQNDTYYTIKIGEHIQENGLDMKDPFSFHEDLPYTYPHYLYDYTTFLIYNNFGMDGIYIATCILSVALGLTIYLVNRKISKKEVLPLVITLIAMYALQPYIAARAQLVTFILFMLEIYGIEMFLLNKKIRYAILLLIIPILIANIHVAVFPFYFVLYMPYIAEYIWIVFNEKILFAEGEIKKIEKKIKNPEEKKEKIEKIKESIQKRKIRREKELQNAVRIKYVKNNNVKWLILLCIIAIFTGLLSPLKTTSYTYLVNTMQGTTIKSISEHQPTIVVKSEKVIIISSIILAILMFTKTKIRLSDLLMLFGLYVLTIYTRRQLSILILVGTVILIKELIILIETVLTKEKQDILEKQITTVIPIILIMVITLVTSYNLLEKKKDDEYIDNTKYPVEASKFIKENLNVENLRLFNEYNYGSYLLFQGIPIFMDSRADLYDLSFNKKENIFEDYMDTSNLKIFYEDTFKKYDITHVILYEKSKINTFIKNTGKEKYKQIYKDDYFVIYKIEE